jgi:predicted acetyltransferase
MRLIRPAFRFLEPGALRDGELTLAEPERALIDPHLAAVHHPETVDQMPQHALATKESFSNFILANPRGRQVPDSSRDIVPAYHFWMRIDPKTNPALEIAGVIGFRIASTESILLYFGHLGYHVYPAARGHHYAERACRLLLPLARAHGFRSLWITCNPENLASRRTCERLGGRYIDCVTLPEDNVLYRQGDRAKLRYEIAL